LVRTRMIWSVSSFFRPVPSIGSNLPLYIKIGRVHGSLGSLAYMVYMRRSPGGRCSGVDGPWRCCGAEEALGIVRLLYSDALTVMLCRLGPDSTRCTFRRLPWWWRHTAWGADERAREPWAPKAIGGFCPLVSRAVRDLRRVVNSVVPAVQSRGGPCQGWPRTGLGRAPKSWAEAVCVLGLCLVLGRKVHASAPEGCSHQAPERS
jgi:hypothetical protein